ncbi:MAG TPA: cellulase family glycosylhydrolase [Chloroflexota bacterium]|jgi:hypothetical protein|nr:cellulase family glycosylhydrolase [Chloroflexota bacterium]
MTRRGSLPLALAFALLLVLALRAGAAQAPPPLFRTAGHVILGPDGQPYLMHGLNRPSLEWQPEGDNLSPSDVDNMAGWGANTIRIPTNQDFLLADSCHSSPDYLATLDALVGWVNAAGMNALIDLHWSDGGDPCIAKMGQQEMADARSLRFWQTLATHYKANPRVFFELYNEPHGITWQCWLHGCITDQGWRAVGMQDLYNAVRAAGFRNLVFVGGLDWSRDLSGVQQYAVQGDNIVYATHPYYDSADAAQLQATFGALTATYPIVATEFGPFAGQTPFCSPSVMTQLIGYFDAPDGNRANRIGWIAWAWYAAQDVCAFPAVISDWNGTPAANGVPVKAALQRYRRAESNP